MKELTVLVLENDEYDLTNNMARLSGIERKIWTSNYVVVNSLYGPVVIKGRYMTALSLTDMMTKKEGTG